MGSRLSARDVALGAVVAGTRAGATAGRLALLPVRVAARTPVVGPVLRRAGEGLASDGRTARAESRRHAEAAANELLEAPEIERTVDRALAGPLTDAVARSLAEHRVAERVATEVLASADFEDAVAAALENERTERTIERAVANPGLERVVIDVLESRLTAQLTERVLRSPELQRTVGQIVASPELRAALGQQTRSLGEEIASGVRRRTDGIDDGTERVLRGWLRRPRTAAVDGAHVPYGGLLTRAVAFAIDLGIAGLIALAAAGLLALVQSLVGELRPAWLVGTLIGIGWALVVGSYLVLFWSIAGQTPGMRLMSLRLTSARGDPPGLGRSLLRLAGLVLAIVPMFAGFIPVLVDDRRRALQDFLAGTVVVNAEQAQLARVSSASAADPASAGFRLPGPPPGVAGDADVMPPDSVMPQR
jgi:uncharacterized RDD family membrane protein YckC